MARFTLPTKATFFCLAITAFAGACANRTSDAGSLKFAEAVTLTTLDGRESTHKAGEAVALPKDPVKVESPGNVTMLLVPVDTGAGGVEVKMRKLENWGGAELDRETNRRLNKVVERIVTIQRALSSRQGREALRMVEDLQSQHPGLTYLDFLKASALVLMGDREGARVAVDNALASFPDNAAGRALQNSLSKGGR